MEALNKLITFFIELGEAFSGRGGDELEVAILGGSCFIHLLEKLVLGSRGGELRLQIFVHFGEHGRSESVELGIVHLQG